MAKDNVIQFPKSIEKEKRLKMKQARVDEIQLENDWLSADIEHLQKTLEESIGKDTELDLKVDPSLLGGIKLRIENTYLDASIKAKMDNLRRDLLQ